jgi:aspartokinase/homoserine dehydrogenase 1
MKILKFGGSSVRDAGRIRSAGSIIAQQFADGPVVVVLSAMKGITDGLESAARTAEAGDSSYEELLQTVESRHLSVVDTLLAGELREACRESVRVLLHELGDILHGVRLVRECSKRTMDLVLSFGERLNCTVTTAYLRQLSIPARLVDAREMIVTDELHGQATVEFSLSYANIKRELNDPAEVPVVTGFIAATATGITTTIGRNGSDYTASILGAGLGADSIEIWTDVDGVLSADPRFVSSAFVIPKISYHEAMELSYFGAEVLHPSTMIPAVERSIPVWIKNTMHPESPGTMISAESLETDHLITGIASIERISLINIEGGGMVGLPGIASRIFAALARAKVNIIMISQASSEHSICIVFRQEQMPAALDGLKRELAREIEAKQIQDFKCQENLEIVAVIGENMKGRPGISGRLFGALGRHKVNVLAIAQGSSEMNISFVVEGRERERVLNIVHQAFFGDGDR